MSETSDQKRQDPLGETLRDLAKIQESTNLTLSALMGTSALTSLERIARSLETIAETKVEKKEVEVEEVTPTMQPWPKTELPVEGNDKEIVLPDGRRAPSKVVRALAEYDSKVWPGALIPNARAAVAHLVISTMEEDLEPVLRTRYPFCLSPNPDSLESPCVLRADHRSKHRDNNDGTW